MHNHIIPLEATALNQILTNLSSYHYNKWKNFNESESKKNPAMHTSAALANMVPSGENLRWTTGEATLVLKTSFHDLFSDSPPLLFVSGDSNRDPSGSTPSREHIDMNLPPTSSCEPVEYNDYKKWFFNHNIILTK